MSFGEYNIQKSMPFIVSLHTVPQREYMLTALRLSRPDDMVLVAASMGHSRSFFGHGILVVVWYMS